MIRNNNQKNRRYTSQRMMAAVLVATMCIGVFHNPMYSYATSQGTDETNETNEQSQESTGDNGTVDASVSQARQDAEEASKNRKAAQEILNALTKTKNNIEDYIVKMDLELNEVQVEITNLEMNQKELEKTIKDTEESLERAKAAQEMQYEEMKKRIRMVYESGDKRYLDVLLTASSMADMMNKTEYASQVSLYDYGILKRLKDAKEQVANLNQKLQMDLASNKSLQEEVQKQKEEMEALVEEKTQQLEQYNASIETQQAEVEKYAKAQAEAEAIIAAAEQAASTSATSTYTGGVFTWPAPGNFTITSPFGERVSPVPGASSNHKGIDIACGTGDPIVAAADGTVIVATYNSAEGNYVCIDHGGGVVTVYMHNSQLLVSVGESVVAGQNIAAAGSTGVSNGPHCHFGVRVDGVYVNPMQYLN